VPRYGLHGSIRAQPGRREALVEHLLEAARLVSGAPGCELYAVSTSDGTDDEVWVTEIWRTQADHDASLAIPGVRELIGRARPLIAEMGETRTLSVRGAHGVADS
jgi:quinol monooxygenase YgiN